MFLRKPAGPRWGDARIAQESPQFTYGSARQCPTRQAVSGIGDSLHPATLRRHRQRVTNASKMGQRDLKRLLISGAMAVVSGAVRRGETTDPWLDREARGCAIQRS